MNETEWLESVDPWQMLIFLQDGMSDRKRRLLALACCRRFWDMLRDPLARKAIEVAEQFTDGLVDRAQLAKARRGAETARGFTYYDSLEELATDIVISVSHAAAPWPGLVASRAADLAGDAAVYGDPEAGIPPSETPEATYDAARLSEQIAQAVLIRELFGNPFQRVKVDPAWLTSTTTAIAGGMYESGDFSAMPMLADALQEAGCENVAILDHCRGPEPHVRGCWVVDLVLEKK